MLTLNHDPAVVRALFSSAVARSIFCPFPSCGAALDESNAVTIEAPGHHVTACARCFDRLRPGLEDSPTPLEVIDGRALFGSDPASAAFVLGA